ncbi:MAG: hypothetical protein JNL83_25660 [Myxococcales bacterium]|nr:hypothetical protein [Myxococcales bacterium]
MRVAVAIVLSVSLLCGACFPGNPKRQMYAKLAEGGALVAGIGMLYVVNSGADCDAMSMPGGEPDEGCKTKAAWLGNVGLGLVLIGLLGFIATVSTADEDKPVAPVVVPKPEDTKPDDKKPEDKTPAPAPTPAPAADPGTGGAPQGGAPSP